MIEPQKGGRQINIYSNYEIGMLCTGDHRCSMLARNLGRSRGASSMSRHWRSSLFNDGTRPWNALETLHRCHGNVMASRSSGEWSVD